MKRFIIPIILLAFVACEPSTAPEQVREAEYTQKAATPEDPFWVRFDAFLVWAHKNEWSYDYTRGLWFQGVEKSTTEDLYKEYTEKEVR